MAEPACEYVMCYAYASWKKGGANFLASPRTSFIQRGVIQDIQRHLKKKGALNMYKYAHLQCEWAI